MIDPRIEKLADVIVNYSVAVRPGDKVAIMGEALAEPLLKAVYVKTLQAGGFPLMQVAFDDLEELLYRYASDAQLQHVPPSARLITETYDCRIRIISDINTKALSNVDPAKLVLARRATTELMEIFMRRAARKELRWALAPFPNNSWAQDADMGLEEYEDFVYGACLPDMADPIACWKRVSARQQRVVDWLKGKKSIHVVGPETDLRMSIAGRTFENCDGHYNIPDGEVYTGPVEDSVEGHVCFSFPAIHDGHEVTGVRLWFEKGRVVRATAEKNEEHLLKTLDTDEGARRVGEFAIGANEGITRFTRQILFDEKIGGSFHMALGAGYPETGSVNKSALHWDMICDLRPGGEIRVDGQVLHRDGKFAIEF